MDVQPRVELKSEPGAARCYHGHSSVGTGPSMDIQPKMWDEPTMKLIADSRGRLTAAELFKPGRAFDASVMPDGSIRIVELVEKAVPVAEVEFNRDGTIACSQRVSREEIFSTLRADREGQ